MKIKRKESDLVTACLKYLKVLENLGDIEWFDRLNSGTIYLPQGKRRISLCRKGTPDIYIRFPNLSRIFWVECKKNPKEKLSDSQREFKERMQELGDSYWVVTTIDRLKEYLGDYVADENII